MDPNRFSSENNLNILRVLTLLRGQKYLRKIPNKTVAYYAQDSTAFPPKAGIESSQKKTSNEV